MADFLNRAGNQKWVYYRNRGNGFWASGVANNNPPSFSLNSSDTRLMDLNFDKKTDLVRTNPDGTWSYCLSGEEPDLDLAPFDNFPGAEDIDQNANGKLEGNTWNCIGSESVSLWSGILFQNPSVRLADMNGDRLQDVVWLRKNGVNTQIGYWLRQGATSFSQYAAMDNQVEIGSMNIGDLKLTDINSDGLSDLVKVRPGQVTAWFNLGNGTSRCFL